MQASLLRQCSRHACLARPPHAGKAHDIQPVALPQRKIDVVGFGNLCVDVFQEVDSLPPAEHAVRKALLDELTRTCTDRSAWELGGNTNFMIAAARLGMNTAAVGHTGSDVFGQFLDSVLQEEGIRTRAQVAENVQGTSLDSTLVCFVLVDPNHKHAFCSRYDFGPWPLLEGVTRLPPNALQVLRSSRAVFTNGFVFDEMPGALVQSACQDAIDHGAAVFFDPGPRCHTMLEGSRRKALDGLLDLSDCVLMTEEEAIVTTGVRDAEAAAWQVLSRPNTRAQWVVVKMGGAGALLASRNNKSTQHAKAIQVDVLDTVGCGDSFAAAIVMGYINRYSVPVTLALATAVGAATASARGAGRNVARAHKVLELLSSAANSSAGGGGVFSNGDGGHGLHGHSEMDAIVYREAMQLLEGSLLADKQRRLIVT